jgi:hypothetical protein
LPSWLWATLAAILAVVATGVADKLCWHSGWFEAAGLVVLGATLAAVVVYVFFTARLAEEAWSASASLVLSQVSPGAAVIDVEVRNHSRLAVTAWCRLNATVNGQAVPSIGFYAGASPMLLQPFGEVLAYFDIRAILQTAGTTLAAVQALTAPANTRTQLRFDVEFWYRADATGREYRNPRQPYYVDMSIVQLVADF